MSFSLIIQPHDVVLFRDGKPFSAGSDTRARSLFPPTPFTIQGAIRARVLFSKPITLGDYYNQTRPEAKELLNLISSENIGYGQLRLRGPFLARKENCKWVRYFPLPADVMRVGTSCKFLQPHNAPEWRSNLPEGLYLPWLKEYERPEEAKGWISKEGLSDYLKGKAPQKVLSESEFVDREHRFGIAVDRRLRTVRQSHLYLAEFLRLKEDVAFWVEVEGIREADLGGEKGFLQLGGEGRAAYYEVLEAAAYCEVPEPDAASDLIPPSPLPQCFKVVLLTPAWFSDGWQPEGGNWGKFFKNGSVRLVSAVIPRYQSIGGAYANQKQAQEKGFQRPIRRFVPAGSVYFFKGDGTVQWAGKPFTETPDGEGDYGQIGFGTCVITKANWEPCLKSCAYV